MRVVLTAWIFNNYSCTFTLVLSLCEVLESEKPSNLANKLLEKA